MTDVAMHRPRPTKLGHLVLKVRDIKKSVAFYTDVVGLEVSDWIDDRMVFMRCGADHHDLALLQLPDGHATASPGVYASVEHFSYHLETYAELEMAARMLGARGIEIDRGIGRHGPGDNTFLVFRDPDGNNVEFYTDMTQITADRPYTPSVWDGRALETFDQWRLERFLVPPPERIQALVEQEKRRR